MRLGAPVWPFKWEPPYEDALRRIAGLGFRAVELNASNGDILANYYTPGYDKGHQGHTGWGGLSALAIRCLPG